MVFGDAAGAVSQMIQEHRYRPGTSHGVSLRLRRTRVKRSLGRDRERPVLPVELELDLHLVARHRFAADHAGPSAPCRVEHAVRTSRWQLPAANCFSGLLSENRFVRHFRPKTSSFLP
jgi:hypothetical protein